MKEIEELFSFAEQARHLKGVISQSSVTIKDSSREIGKIKNPDKFILTVTGIREANRPFVDKIRLAQEELDGIARQVVPVVSKPGVLARVQEELDTSSRAVAVVEEGVREKTLPEELLELPNIRSYRQRAADLTLILELHQRGIPLLDVPSAKDTPLEARRMDFRNRIVMESNSVAIDGVAIKIPSKPNQAVLARVVQDLETMWGDSLGVHSKEVDTIAQAHGYQGSRPGSNSVGNLNEVFGHHNLKIRIGSTPDPENKRYRYYRFASVEPAIPRVDIPKFRPEAYKLPSEPFPPTPLRDYLSLRSLQEVTASLRIDEDTKVLLEQFRVSPAASYAILNAIVKFNEYPRGEQEAEDFFRRLGGDFSAELGCIQLQPKYRTKGLTLLSPYEKFILFRNAHQEKAIVDPSGYGTSFEIAGVPYLPDGLVICETDQALEVVEIVEYKNVTSRDRSTIQRIIEQHARFTTDELDCQLRLTDPEQPIDPLFLGEFIHDKLRPNLSPKPLVVSPKMRVVYAVPEGAALPIENIELEYVHISSGEIGHLLRLLTTALK